MFKTACLAICIATIGHLAPAFAETKPDAVALRAIPYSSPAAALAALRAKDGVVFSKQSDWLTARDTDGGELVLHALRSSGASVGRTPQAR